MKVLYFAKEAWEEEYIKSTLQNTEWVAADDPRAEVLSVFVNHPVDAALMAKYPALKLIATRSTGFDHIDLAEAKRRGIAVASVPSYGVNTVAEFAFALLLALSRRVCEAAARVKGGSFSQAGLTGFDLAGKTIGVVGCGKIGQHLVRMAKGFDMQVLVSDAHRDEKMAAELGFTYALLPELLAQSDVISLHVPYFKETHHLINKENISKIKKGAYLINTSRGAVVETAALVQALRDGTLAGAGLDVLEEEGDMADEMHLLANGHPKQEELEVMLENHYLMSHPRVLVTPHVAFDTREALERIINTTAENITAFAAGVPVNLVP
ncbi:MAG: NAD(P)-dependent oxidoreductase [Patescibacteria group bacterium]